MFCDFFFGEPGDLTHAEANIDAVIAHIMNRRSAISIQNQNGSTRGCGEFLNAAAFV